MLEPLKGFVESEGSHKPKGPKYQRDWIEVSVSAKVSECQYRQ